ncbi:hydroxyacylglutathione hydrolase [Ideonella sp.]|uniref:hydroxyacylglutathione hydrolase n=1 Tax=Ideonella sp. TaxID=1929293 RepID=UPI003BB622EC
MKLLALPAFTDNYIWMIHDGAQALVVDPGDAAPVLQALQAHGLTLSGILVTHHHADHVGGLADLLPHLQGPIWAPAHERMPVDCSRVGQGDTVQWHGLSLVVLDVPGHTAGHVAYFAASGLDSRPLLFCGDTLFSGGCGRLFEGTPAQMHDSLSQLVALPDDTQVCCTHEYTLSNLRFARVVEPGNADLQAYQAHCQALRERGQPTLPARLLTERQINPFLRCDVPAVRAAAEQRAGHALDTVATLAALREWKNQF